MTETAEYIKRLEEWIDSQKSELYQEIEEIEASDEPDLLIEPMTEVELLELKIEVLDEVIGVLLTLK